MKWNNLKYNNHKIMKTNLIICERFIGYFSVNKSFLENILIRDLMEIAEAHNPCISCDNHVDQAPNCTYDFENKTQPFVTGKKVFNLQRGLVLIWYDVMYYII